MVDLPKLTNDSVTRPIQTNLSGAEVSSPYMLLSHSLDKASEGLNEVAVEQAKKAGEQAGSQVRVDDNGNMVGYEKAPFIVGPASVAYKHAALMTAAAKMQPEIENNLLKLRLEHPNDPEQFKAAAGDYGKTLLAKLDDPHLQVGIGQMVSQAAAHNYRTSMVEANSNQTAEALQTYQARIKDINEHSASLARQGLIDTPEYKALQQSRAQFYNELGIDKRFKFSPERAALELKEARDQDVVQSVIGDAQRIFQSKRNAAAAQQYLQEKFWGEGSDKLNLTAAKRDHAVAEGMHALASLTAQDREAVAENRQAVTSYISTMRKDPSLFSDIQHNDMEKRALEIGDYKSIADLREARVWQPVWKAFKGMSPQQQADNLTQLSRGVIPDAASADFLQARAVGRGVRLEGISPVFADRLHVALRDAEAATGETGRIESLKRTTAEQAELYRRYQAGQGGLAAPPGKSRHEAGEAADIPSGKVLDFLHQNAAKYGLEFLPGNAFTKDPGHIQMAAGQVQLPGGPNVTRIDFGADNATTRLWSSTMADWRASVSKFADASFAGIEAKSRSRDAFAPGELDNFVKMATLSGREDLIEKARPLIAAQEMAGKIAPGEGQAVISQAEAAKSGADPIVHAALTRVIENVKADEKAIREEPLNEGARRGWNPPINPLNPENPEAFAGELQNRQKSAGLLLQRYPTYGPVPVIGKTEAEQLGVSLTSGDPAKAVQMLTALRTLPDQTYVATMAQPGLKDALIAMSRSSEPTRFAAGMNTLATLWKTHPAEFEHIYGGSTLERLMAYRGLQGSLTAPEVIERLNKADDPATTKARKDVAEAVDTEFKTWKPEDVAYQLGSSWGIPGTQFIGRAIGSIPAVSSDPIAAGEMKFDFENTVKSLRMYGVPSSDAQKLAVERLKATWQSSEIAGNTLMKRAPEAYYPAIDGNHDWMKGDLRDHITSVLGPQISVESTTEGIGRGTTPNWTFKGLVSDAQTEREVKTGKPPSYVVAYTDAKGMTQFLDQRIAWDTKGPMEAFTARQKKAFESAAERERSFQRGGAEGLSVGPHSMLDYLNPISSAAAMEPPKLPSPYPPGRMPLDAGGGGGPAGGSAGGRIQFESTGAKRGEFKQPSRSQAPVLTPEEAEARKAAMKAEFDRAIQEIEAKTKKPRKAPEIAPSAGRIGFDSLGTKK